MFDHRRVRKIPGHLQRPFFSLLETFSQRIGLLRRLGTGISMHFNRDIHFQLIRRIHQPPGHLQGALRRRIVVEHLYIDHSGPVRLDRAQLRFDFLDPT